MGRPPKKIGTLMKQVTLWLDPKVMARGQETAGKQKVSEFVRGAIESALDAQTAPSKTIVEPPPASEGRSRIKRLPKKRPE